MDLCLLFGSVTFTFAACELGEMTSNEFNALNEAFYQCNWYLLSTQTERVFLMVVANTQQPVIIGGYAKTSCMRDTFKEVFRDFEFSFLPKKIYMRIIYDCSLLS